MACDLHHEAWNTRTMKRTPFAAPIISLAVLTQACFSVEYQETLRNSPSNSAQSLLGDWRSANAGSFPTPQTCGDLKWNVTSQDATHIAGSFEATCGGGVTLAGTATGVLDGNLRIEATGNATGLVPFTCPFTVNGTGVLQADSSLRVDYYGSTCVGAISGTEILRR
jgi:hypothetical protein